MADVTIVGRGRLHRPGDARPGARAPGAAARRRRLRLARGEDGGRARPPARAAEMPSVRRRTRRRSRPQPTSRSSASRTRRPPRSRRRRTGSSSISRARIGSTTPTPTSAGTASPTPGRRASASGSTGLTELVPETGRLIANPGCYATATLLALGPIRDAIDQESVVVDGLSGMTGAGRSLKASLPRWRRARERLPLPRRRPPARARDRAVARLPRLPDTAPPAAPARPDRDLQRPLDMVQTLAPCSRRPTPGAGRDRAARGRLAGARACPAHRPRRDRRLRGPLHRAHDGDLRRGQPRQGRRRTGDPERQPGARARRDSRAASGRGARYERHRRPGLRRDGRHRRACGRRACRTSPSCGRCPRAVGAAVWTTNRVQAAPVTVSRRHLGAGAAAGRADQCRLRERRHRSAGRGRRARLGAGARARARPRARGGRRPLDGRDRGAACRSTRCSPAPAPPRRSSPPTAARRLRTRS